jgi:hypothetical protein
MNARELARVLGGHVAGDQKVLAPGPGHSPKDRSLQVTLSASSPEGLLVHSFCGDDWKLCRDYVRSRLGLPQWQPGDEQDRRIQRSKLYKFEAGAVELEAGARERTEDDLFRISRAVEIWNAAGDPRGTLAERYLRDRRKLDLTDDLVGTVLRFHPRTPWRDENTGRTVFIPALIAVFRSIDDDTITGIHRIALDRDTGSKIDRRMLGIVRRAAIKLGTCGAELAIGEGVETCMAARQLGVKSPCWALGSVGAISFFPILPGVRTLRILGEDDGPSARAIQLCGKRWRAARRRVRVIKPTHGNKDLNDTLLRSARYERTGS